MTENRNRVLHLIMAGILLVSMYLVAGKGAMYVNGIQIESSDETEMKEQSEEVTKKEGQEEICVVVDAGHGGTSIRPKKTV